MAYQTKEIPTIIESHQKEVDIHVVLAGEERIKLFGREDVIVTTPYDAEKDCQFYKAVNPPVIDLHLTPKNMAVLFPQDIHQPQFIAETKSQTIKKVVVKVKEFVFGEH
ncbi:Protein yiaL (fragment) [Capnocytophaga canimorsus]|uniref:Protein yiaL n=2 Tax=Capnocytophaga canimorsus TaxID=28188 RepID=A0A0B7IHW3_9FLAO